jgi:hypothetical protein
MNFNINNLRFVYFTNENNIPLLKLTLSNFFKYNNLENIKVSVISNNYTDDILPYSDVVQYLNGNTPFNGQGNHFSNSLKNTLSKIKEEYIFLLLDDYHFIDDTKFSDLQKLMEFIVAEDVDYFGFDDVAANLNADGWSPYYEKWLPYENENYPFGKESLYYRDNNYRYLFSVQPTIWKRKSLMALCDRWEFSLHGLDETLPQIKQENKLKCFGNSHRSHFTYKSSDDYFVIAYVEIMRHGGFQHYKNCNISPDDPVIIYIDQLIKEHDLLNKPEYRKILGNIT